MHRQITISLIASPMKIQHSILFVLLLFFSAQFARSQVNKCALNLVKAQEQFNAGQIEEVPGLLLDCIEDGFTTEDRIEAFKLLINAYIFDGYPDLAEEYMMIFLNEYPDYEVSDDDPYEFAVLFDQFDNKPRYSIGAFLGTNFSGVSVKEPFGVYNVNLVEGDYSGTAGFHFGGSFQYFLRPKIELSVEAMYSKSGFEYEVNPFPFTTTIYTEQQSRFDIPVSVIYSFNSIKFSPYLRFGFNNSILLSSGGEYVRSYANTGGVDIDNIESEVVDLSDSRKSFALGTFLGGGARYKLPKAYLFLDLRYNIGFTNQVVSESRRVAGDDVWLFYNRQDDFAINNFAITIGYTRKFYNPKRKN